MRGARRGPESDMTVDDLDDVLAIERLSFQTPWSRHAFQYELTQNRVARCLVVREGRALSGYLCLWEIGREVHITNVAVDPARRRRGLARACCSARVLEDARTRNVELVFLEVRPTNGEAVAPLREPRLPASSGAARGTTSTPARTPSSWRRPSPDRLRGPMAGPGTDREPGGSSRS